MTQSNKPLIIGVSGGIGSGKSTVSAFMADRDDAFLIDADLLAREAAADENILSEIKNHFGNDIFDESGALKRHELGKIIFSSEKEREFLNSVTHPYIRRRFFELAEENFDKSFIIYDCPLLFEAALYNDVDVSVLVYVNRETQIERIMARDGFERKDALMRIEAQMEVSEKLKLADCVIYNDASVEELKETCLHLPDMLREKCR